VFEIECFITDSCAGDLNEFPSTEHERATWLSPQELRKLEPAGKTTKWLAAVAAERLTEHRRGMNAC
jgi:hypothetical protein